MAVTKDASMRKPARPSAVKTTFDSTSSSDTNGDKGPRKSKKSDSPPSPSTRLVSPLMQKVLVGPGKEAPLPPALDDQEIHAFRAWWAPLLIIIGSYILAAFIPATVYTCKSSLLCVFDDMSLHQLVDAFPRPTMTAAGIYVGWALFQGLLLEFLPGKDFYGPPTPEGERPHYKDNGMVAWVITHGLYVILGPMTGLIPFGDLYAHWGSMIAAANLFMVPFCGFLNWKGKYYPSSRDAVWTGRPLFDYFQGVELHPRIFGMNVKQFLNCRVSMMGWSMSLICFAHSQYDRGELSTGMIVSCALHVLYLCKFFWWETGYFGSIDIIHDRCGYYIIWGVCVWVPTVYCLAGFSQVEHPQHWPMPVAVAVFAAGMFALYVNYMADYQRQIARATDGAALIWGKKAQIIRAEYTTGDGENRKSLLLTSGYWGLSRHFHYVPELTLAFMWSLSAGAQFLMSWLYFVFLFILLVDRANRDEEKCRAKYGKYWKEYCKRVPYKIMPYVY